VYTVLPKGPVPASTTASASAPSTTSTTAACTPPPAHRGRPRRPRTSCRTSSSASGGARGVRRRRGELGPYLRLMARSRALDLWREGQAAGRASDRLQGSRPRTTDGRATRRRAPWSARRAAARARRRCSRLPVGQREALVLAYWGGLTRTRSRSASHVPLGTAKSRIRLGLARLRDECGESSASPPGRVSAASGAGGPALIVAHDQPVFGLMCAHRHTHKVRTSASPRHNVGPPNRGARCAPGGGTSVAAPSRRDRGVGAGIHRAARGAPLRAGA
jgi:RNA polymerase sigma-70 factor (ECF subfamily)